MARITQVQAKKIGKLLKVDFKKVSLRQFTMGLNEELEHRDVTAGNLRVTARIALAHLRERPDYYTRLKRAMRR